MSLRKRTPLLLVLASIFLIGAKCTVVASSGSGSSSGGSSSSGRAAARSSSGNFSGCSERCLKFSTGSRSGFTGPDGEFAYGAGAHIRFFIGDLALGEEVDAGASMTPAHLFPNGSQESRAVINLTRLLISLDSTPADAAISIPRKVHDMMVHSNADVSPWIGSMNFEDEAEFLNAVSQILAVCAQAYPFTPSLADRDAARRWLRELP